MDLSGAPFTYPISLFYCLDSIQIVIAHHNLKVCAKPYISEITAKRSWSNLATGTDYIHQSEYEENAIMQLYNMLPVQAPKIPDNTFIFRLDNNSLMEHYLCLVKQFSEF